MIVVINLAVGILPHVDNFAHIGGFLTGFLLGFVLLPRPQLGWMERRNRPAGVRVNSKYKGYQYVLGLLSLMLLVAGLVLTFHFGSTSSIMSIYSYYLSYLFFSSERKPDAPDQIICLCFKMQVYCRAGDAVPRG